MTATSIIKIVADIAQVRRLYEKDPVIQALMTELEIRLLIQHPANLNPLPAKRDRRKRRANGTFDRKSYQRVYMRDVRAGKPKGERGIDIDISSKIA